jgi:hypothetical protein
MAPHAHAAWLPQVAYAAGAILPYPAMVGPERVAQATLETYKRMLMPDLQPAIRQEPQPEAVARAAKRMADAMAAGMRPPSFTDRRLLRAAEMINRGQPFIIRSAGRAAVVRPAGPANPAGVPSQVTVNRESSVLEPGRTLSWSR